MDVKGAYDPVHILHLIKALNRASLPKRIFEWTSSILSDCQARLKHEGSYLGAMRDVNLGLPQGVTHLAAGGVNVWSRHDRTSNVPFFNMCGMG